MPETTKRPCPVVLVVRDGWGRNPNREHDAFNALHLAQTPVSDALLRDYPWTLVKTSGEDVGLPVGTMGNSEVGHQNLGAGRIVNQDSVRITKAIRDGSFYDNEALVRGVQRAKGSGGSVHFLGLASDAGVHALLTHLYACLELCRRQGQQKVYLHLFTDGRDTGPYTGTGYIAEVEAKCAELGVGRIASLSGRYYAMDRDNRWERVARAYDALTGRGDATPHFATASEAMDAYYKNPTTSSQEGDEFITPRTLGENPGATRIQGGDTVIFYNYRGDRPREITRAFVFDDFYGHVKASPDSGEKGFDRGQKLDLAAYVTLAAYEEALGAYVDVAYPKPPRMANIGAAYLASLGLRQFRCAETEKFPHVTFFFNDYRDEPFPGESRHMPQSPRVATYDLKPEMSAPEICAAVLAQVRTGDAPDFILVNFANTDMVGHTGKLDPAIAAAEVVDDLVGRLVEAVLERGGKLVVTADHGNSEQMYDPKTEAPHTAHTTYDVELIVVDPDRRSGATGSAEAPSPALVQGGRLADVFPTVLELMELEVPEEMSGRSLLKS